MGGWTDWVMMFGGPRVAGSDRLGGVWRQRGRSRSTIAQRSDRLAVDCGDESALRHAAPRQWRAGAQARLRRRLSARGARSRRARGGFAAGSGRPGEGGACRRLPHRLPRRATARAARPRARAQGRRVVSVVASVRNSRRSAARRARTSARWLARADWRSSSSLLASGMSTTTCTPVSQDLEHLAPLDGVRAALGLDHERLADANAAGRVVRRSCCTFRAARITPPMSDACSIVYRMVRPRYRCRRRRIKL